MTQQTVGWGSTGPDVERVQRLLGARRGAAAAPTGRFDGTTLAAVIALQVEHGLAPTGVVDAAVWPVLTAGEAQPSAEDPLDRAAAALAAGRVPTFEGSSSDQVARSFRELFPGLSADPGRLEDLKARVAASSGGAARLVDADPGEFTVRPKGPAAFLALERGGERRRVVLQPTADPVAFDS